MRSPEELASFMAASTFSPREQIAQTRFRTALVRDWAIPLGARVLEIGCGQGDTTAVLADVVGPSGHVTAVDLANPSYGSPVNLGDSARFLSEGPLGDRITFHFGFDVLSFINAFPANAFDVIVLAHCTWYFDSLDRLRTTLQTIKPWANRLCLSEWDFEPRQTEQMGHLLAVLIQGQVEAYKYESISNVRTPYSRETLHRILKETGWAVETQNVVETKELADARWEISACLANSSREISELKLPPKLAEFLESQLGVLQRLSEKGENLPLPAYSIVAARD